MIPIFLQEAFLKLASTPTEHSVYSKHRCARRQALMARHTGPVLSFHLSAAHAMVCGSALCRAFREGMERLEDALKAHGAEIAQRQVFCDAMGGEALWAVCAPSSFLRRLCIQLEREDALSGLFCFYVLDAQTRAQAAANTPTVRSQGVQDERRIIQAHFAQQDRGVLAAMAAKALLYEVCTAPKPGLVDRFNNGSHRDMDLFTFLDSTAALIPYFETAVRLGQETAHRPPQETFLRLRRAGLRAERDMFRATGGINTHKGAVFTLGTVCGAVGRLWSPAGPPRDCSAVLSQCSLLCTDAVREDWKRMARGEAVTAGQRLYRSCGIQGIRGELARGLPSVAQVSLPALEQELSRGASLEQAGVTALLQLIAHLTDTNLIARGGLEGQRWAARQAQVLLREGHPSPEQVRALDDAFIRRNLSPGGCADLLAVTYLLHFLRTLPDPACVPCPAGGKQA